MGKFQFTYPFLVGYSIRASHISPNHFRSFEKHLDLCTFQLWCCTWMKKNSLLNRLLKLWNVSYPLSTIYFMLKIIAKLLPPTVIMESCIVSYLQCGLLTTVHPCSLDLKFGMTGNQNMMQLHWHRLLLFKYSNLDSGGQLLSPAPPPGDSQQPRSLLFAS